MLPFLKPKRVVDAGVITSVRTPDGKITEQSQEDNDGIKAAAADLIRAIHAKDEDAAAEALKAAFEICDSNPHVEGPHTYDAQKED